MQRISFGLGIILGGIIFLAGTCEANPFLNPNNSHYYEAISGEHDWEEARNLASSLTYLGLNGHLVTITSIEEQNWVWVNLNEPFRYLLGASDHETEGTWKWVTDEPWNFENWRAGEPNSGNGWYDEDALSFYYEGKWNDLPYTHDINIGPQGPHPYVLGYVVEYEYIVPEPASMLIFGIGCAAMALVRRRRKAL